MKISTFKPNTIVIKLRGLALTHRVTRTQFVGGVEIAWAVRVKADKGNDCWVSFGKEKALLPFQHRQFMPDDYHYIK